MTQCIYHDFIFSGKNALNWKTATLRGYPHPFKPLVKDADPIIPSLSSADEVTTRPHTAKLDLELVYKDAFFRYLDSSFKCQTRCLCSIAKLTSFISLPFSRCRESVVLSGQRESEALSSAATHTPMFT